jgi:hypothetical protein
LQLTIYHIENAVTVNEIPKSKRALYQYTVLGELNVDSQLLVLDNISYVGIQGAYACTPCAPKM